MEFRCQHCGDPLSVSDEVIGRHVMCIHCERSNVVPDPTPVLLENVSLAAVLAEVRCPHCGYLLKGLTDNRCPECGRRFDPIRVIRLVGNPRRRERDLFVAGMVAGAILVITLLSLCSGLRFP